ncbi:MAG: methionyl-tRNA formyltransferase [Phycisphaerales bacterium]
MRIVFFGSGAFGVPTLELLARGHEIALVVSQPDRPAGRGKSLTPTPLAARALELGLEVLRPEDVNEASVRQRIRSAGADAWVVIAFGQKLSRELLDGVFAINLHGSLLPAYRGAAPIQRAVMDGCAETGVSVISLAERMDAGLVYAEKRRAIGSTETSDEVHDALAALGPEVISEVLERHAHGTLVGQAQDEARATRARKLSKSDGTIDFGASDAGAARALVNGLNPWPGCTVMVGPTPLKLCRVDQGDPRGLGEDAIGVLQADGRVRARSGAVRILELQPLGGRKMSFEEFVRGRPTLVGLRIEPAVEGPAAR